MLRINEKITEIPVSLNAQFYKNAKAAYLAGSFRPLLSLFNLAEEDAFISGCLTARQAGYKRQYTVVPVSEDARDLRAAEIVNLALENLYVRDLFDGIIDARFKWYSVVALEWGIDSNLQLPIDLEIVHQRYFKYDLKTKELLIDFGNTQKKIPPDSALITEYAKKPIMLTVLKNYILKEGGEQNWATFVEVFGNPFILGKYPPNSSAEYKNELEKGINAAGQSTRGIIPQGTEIDIRETTRNTGDHGDFVNMCREGISMALLGHKDAAGSDASMQIGNNTAGIQVKREIAIDDMTWLEDRLKPFIKMIVDRNIVVERYPRIIFDKSDSVDLRTKLDAAQLALNSGAQIDARFMEEFGIPILNPDQPLENKSLVNLGI